MANTVFVSTKIMELLRVLVFICWSLILVYSKMSAHEQEVHDFMTKMLNLTIYDMADYYATNESIYEVFETDDVEVKNLSSGQEI